MLHGSLCYHAAMPIYDCSHQLGEGLQCGAAMPTFHHPSLLVRERPQIRHRNDTVCTPFPISFMEVDNSQQRCHPDTTSRGKGRHRIAEMPSRVRSSRPVYRGHSLIAERPISKRLAREGSTKACNQQCQSFTTLPTSLWANPCTQKCHGVDAHQLGKDIICTLIKPLLFLPFLLIYGSQRISAEMPRVICSQGEGQFIHHRNVIRRTPFPTILREAKHQLQKCYLKIASHKGRVNRVSQKCPTSNTLPHQFWANISTQKCQKITAQYNQRPLVFRRNAL